MVLTVREVFNLNVDENDVNICFISLLEFIFTFLVVAL